MPQYNQNPMKEREEKGSHKRRYSKISIEKRLKLIKMVLDDGLALTKVAKLLHIKRPTAKVIIRRYKQNGTYFQKKMNPIRTKDSIESQQEIKIEELSQPHVSIHAEQKPQAQVRQPKQSDSEVQEVQAQKGQQTFLIYYPSLPQYQGFI